MNAREAITRAKRLLNDGSPAEAEALLLEHGYGYRPDASVQAEYERAFPLRPDARERLDGYAERLADENPKARLQAAQALARQACGVETVERESWLRNPHATDLASRFLAREPDPRVREYLIVALAEIARRYFRDGRAYPVVAPHLGSDRWNTRRWATQALLEIAGEQSFPDVLPLLGDEDERVRDHLFGSLNALLERSPASAAGGATLRAALLAAAPDGDAHLRAQIAQILVLIPNPSAVPDLTSWLKREKSTGVKKFLQMALDRCH